MIAECTSRSAAAPPSVPAAEAASQTSPPTVVPGDPAPEAQRPLAAVVPFPLPDLSGAATSGAVATATPATAAAPRVRITLGRASLHLEDALALEPDVLVPLDEQSGDHVEVWAGDRLVAYGEVLMMDNRFCVRVVEIVAREPVPSAP